MRCRALGGRLEAAPLGEGALGSLHFSLPNVDVGDDEVTHCRHPRSAIDFESLLRRRQGRFDLTAINLCLRKIEVTFRELGVDCDRPLERLDRVASASFALMQSRQVERRTKSGVVQVEFALVLL